MGKTGQSAIEDSEISARLKLLRETHYGNRGRSRFARELGIPVTSYANYESGRTPPPAVLVLAARLTGTSLEWLLTGDGSRSTPSLLASKTPSGILLQELYDLLEEAPQLVPVINRWVAELKSQEDPLDVIRSRHSDVQSGLIPVVGSTAAGLAHFWKELDVAVDGALADSRLEQVLDKHFLNQASPSGPGSEKTHLEQPVSLVQYSQPDAFGFLEFLNATGLKARYPKAVAWRIDGLSMSPRYQDGDLVLTSPDEPAVELQPCVARQRNQIGVNCKLFQTDGDDVLLIPVNETIATQRFPKAQLLWAWRVLAFVRLKAP